MIFQRNPSSEAHPTGEAFSAEGASNDAQGAREATLTQWVDIDEVNRASIELNRDRPGMIVRSEAMRQLMQTVERLGPYKATVLVHGESGTGKELVARALHTLGPMSGPFVTFNCSNLLESLAEAQLFGHVRGAFTDAREDSLGYFRSANGGTLFLDEIGELPLRLQPKLLRAVELHEIQPVGSAQTYKVNIRLIAATNRDLRAMVAQGTFRDDLYYRLSATAITIPPLRDRRDGIDSLVAHFIDHYNRLFGKQVRWLSREALELMRQYDWPGNVRELSHAIQSAVMLCDSDRIDAALLPEAVCRGRGAEVSRSLAAPSEVDAPAPLDRPTPAAAEMPSGGGPLLLDEVIKQTLMRSLEETDGNRRRAADLLGISRSTLYRMLARYSLAEDETYRASRRGGFTRRGSAGN